MDNYERAMSQGYYFDRRIDLEFYDKDGTKLYELKTPAHGIKPAITVKGTYIEGDYSVDAFIMIQNLSYSADINSVEMIRCSMYYSGMEESPLKVGQALTGSSGITTDYMVLYADQDKEPPNRAVRFQCVVASECKEMFDIPMSYKSSGTIDLDDGKPSAPESGTGGKAGAKITMKLSEYLKRLAEVRNQYLDGEYTGKRAVFKDTMKITSIELPKGRGDMEVSVSPGKYTFGESLRRIGSMVVADESSPEYCKLKAATFNGSIVVTVIPPGDWELRAKAAGCVTDAQIENFHAENYSNEREITSIGGGGTPVKAAYGTRSNPITLNFVRAAYRSEVLVSVSVMYDNRISPGRFCTINGKAIMGRGSSASRSFSRLTKAGDNVTIEVVGAVEYEFSTVSTSYMNFSGPIV